MRQVHIETSSGVEYQQYFLEVSVTSLIDTSLCAKFLLFQHCIQYVSDKFARHDPPLTYLLTYLSALALANSRCQHIGPVSK